jgi:glycosyltransferase involved in cell wall biosynthesis
MKILHIAYDYDTASASARLASRQAAQGHEIFFYSKHGLQRFQPGVRPSSSPAKRVGPLLFNRIDGMLTRLCRKASPGFFSAGLFGYPIPRQVRAERWDKVHVHWIASGFCSLGSALRQLSGQKVVHLHDFWLLLGFVPHAYASESLNALGQVLQKRVRRRHRDIIRKYTPTVAAPSSMAAEFASSLLGDTGARVVVCANLLGEDFAQAPVGARRAGEKLVLLHVMSGGDPLAKGFDQIIEAIRLLPREVAEQLTLVQVGAQVTSVFSVNGCTVRTILPIGPAAMPQVYAAADYTIVWSIAETFSQSAAESLARGTPIITHGGLPPARFCQSPPSLIARAHRAAGLAELLMQALSAKETARQDLYVPEPSAAV